MQWLMLRSCNISGIIADYFAGFSELQNLDLSFNNFTGDIPYLDGLTRLGGVYVTNNSLSGPIPEWIKNRVTTYGIDLSCNNFEEESVPASCRENINLFRSYKSTGNSSILSKCLSSCSRDTYSFHVNCGGSTIRIGKTTFEGDRETSGSAKFVHDPNKNWGTSSTGYFWDTKLNIDDYVTNNISVLEMDNYPLYMTARLSPLSLVYYGRFLANGNYTITLHFAEIMFTSNHSFRSLGWRLFDVYIQGEKKLEDFEIMQEAGGVDKPVKRKFTVLVNNKILEIRFQFTGKGSTSVPRRGVYGPLISAISVESDVKPPNKHKKVVLIALGASLLGLFIILGVIGFCL